jgi:uncharacterized repeat protein (TIGR03803 family)
VYCLSRARLLALTITFLAVSSIPAISYSHLHQFPSNSSPQAPLIQAQDGAFYGTTYTRAISPNYGTVFRVTADGAFTNLFTFGYTNGAYLYAGLVQLGDGLLYGAAQNGGQHHYGTLFRLTTNGALTTLLSFDGANGAYPKGTLIQGSDGALYGTTYGGGAYGVGTVYRIATNGAHTVLASFDTNNGARPSAGLVLARDGAFYGTTTDGGTNLPGFGTLFRITTNGVLTTLLHLGSSYSLTEGHDGRLYGTVSSGGPRGYGYAFAITTNGVYSMIAYFGDSSAGVYPSSALTQAGDGSFWGTTRYEHVYRLGTNGLLSGVASFYNYWNGQDPEGGVVIGRDRGLYGLTAQGGLLGGGVIYRVDLATQMYFITHGSAGWDVLVLGLPETSYQLQRSAGLTGPWDDVADVFTDHFGIGRWTDPALSNRAFYRAVDP